MNQGESVVAAGIRWHVVPSVRQALTPLSLDIDLHIQSGNAHVVKHGPHRTVYRVTVNGLTLFWKHCRISGLRSRLRQCLRPPKARMEFDRALALAARGIPTVEPLAWGERVGTYAGESFLITRELTGAIPLQSLLQPPIEAESRRQLAIDLGRYIAQLHTAGVVHPDLHPGNILVVSDGKGQRRFHLIDLHSIQLGKPLSWERSRENLVVFNRWFAMRSSRADRRRFWKSYAAARNWNRLDERAKALDLERRTAISNRDFWIGRDHRCLGTNRYFRKARSGRAKGLAVREMDEATLRRFLDDPDFPFRDGSCRLLKDSRTSTVAEMIVPTPDGPRAMIYKRFRVKKFSTPLANRLRPSSALRSWQFGYALRNRDLPTPRPWLVLHRRGWSGPREGYLLCEKIENARELQEVVVECSRRRKWELIAELARTIRQFHDSNLSHRDLKSANILWAETFHFIDLVGLSRHRTVSEAKRAKNLTRLNVSFLHNPHVTRTDKLRFLRAYLRWGLYGRAGWKSWWKRIAGESLAKIERNRQTGRPLA